MKTHRTIAIGAALLAGLAAAAPAAAQQQAQPRHEQGHRAHGSPEEHMEHALAFFGEKLSLTDDQVRQIRQIFTEEIQRMHAQHQGGGELSEAQMRAAHERLVQRIEPVLTESQRAEFRRLHDEHGAGQGGYHGRGHPRH